MAGIASINKAREVTTRRKSHWITRLMNKKVYKAGSEPGGPPGRFFVSSVSNPCDRFLWLQWNGFVAREEVTAAKERMFGHGNVTQIRYKDYFKKMGVYVADEIRCTVDYPPISGRADYEIVDLEGKRFLIELKTINVRGWDEDIKEHAKPEHDMQLQMYLNMMDVENGAVLYENKNTFDIRLYDVKRDPAIYEAMLERLQNIIEMPSLPNLSDWADIHNTRYCPCLLEAERS
jgi:hypothetical protein